MSRETPYGLVELQCDGCGWGTTVLAADSYPIEHYVADERRMCGPVLVVDEDARSDDRPETT